MVTAMDRSIGLLLSGLEELGLEKDTLVVFTSDNGPEQVPI
jgi:arylsulfatase A-like enzyme